MRAIKNADVRRVFEAYPEEVRERLLGIRELVFEAAEDAEEVGAVEETLKWGEPSYVAKEGSTVRMDWKSSSPEQVAVYFHCQTKLVDTFKAIYGDALQFDGKRAIVIGLDEDVPVDPLKHCISLSLRYHLVKHLPLLGV